MLKDTMMDSKCPDLDVYVLSRMFDYTGHIARATQRDPHHLTGCLIRFRDSIWKRTMTTLIGHQGHEGRVAPWIWEHQYDSYFKRQDLAWQETPEGDDKQ